MFASLNENGQLIMAEMEPGDVLTAVQAKLDDMNDRYIANSQRDQLPYGLIAQLVEHCTGITEVMGSDPVEV